MEWIKKRGSKSLALMARRKMGKTAILERIYNIVFNENGKVVPFYYEIKEGKRWCIEFFQEFFLTFIYQYLAFKSRNKEYLDFVSYEDFEEAKIAAKKEGCEFLIKIINQVQLAAKNESVGTMWEMVRQTPKSVAQHKEEFILQIIDEFQFLNSEFYRDKATTMLIDDLVSGYLSTAESKVAPLLISGSWVGTLMNMIIMKLPGRFVIEILENMPENEAMDMIFKYSEFLNVPVSNECAYLINEISEGSPFYISCIIRSHYEGKDLTTAKGLKKVVEFETLNYRAEIKRTWMEYVKAAFYKVNERKTKNIVLYLCKNREREVSRKELIEKLNLDMTDSEVEYKLDALIKADIIQQGRSNFFYQGINDNIFDKVFRGVYQDEIEVLVPNQINNEYETMFIEMKAKYQKLLGKYNYQKGYFAEYILINQLKHKAYRDNDSFKAITRNLQLDFQFVEYERVWAFRVSPEYSEMIDIDIYAKAISKTDYSLICEIKNRDIKKFDLKETEHFIKKLKKLQKVENIGKFVLFVFSLSGFTDKAEKYCIENGIAYSDDPKWLEYSVK